MKRSIPIQLNGRPRKSKYGVRTDAIGKAKRTVDGILFASQKEAMRYLDLKLLEKVGAIQGLEIQPKFPIEVRGVRVCTYIADFRYWERQPSGPKVNLRLHIEDVKGLKTPLYKLKKKLAQLTYNVRIEEI